MCGLAGQGTGRSVGARGPSVRPATGPAGVPGQRQEWAGGEARAVGARSAAELGSFVAEGARHAEGMR